MVGHENHDRTDGDAVEGRAHDAAVASAECLQRRGGVHIGDRDNLLTTIGIRLGAADLAELIPAFLHLVDVCHVGHGAAGGQVGQGHTLLGGGEDIGGFSHEVHAAEHDMVGVRAFGGVLGQLEGITHKVGMLDNLITLVEVAEDQQFRAKTLLGVSDALLQFLVGGLAVFVRQHLLVGALCGLGFGEKRVFGQSDFTPEFSMEGNEGASEVRERWYFKLRCENREYQTYCAAFEWVRQALKMNRAVLSPTACAEVETPVLLFQSGRDIWM